MADADRDPRTDPERGDILRSRAGLPSVTDFLVVGFDGETVTYVQDGRHVLECSIAEWRRYAKTDEIVRRGP